MTVLRLIACWLILAVPSYADELHGVQYVRAYDGDTITVNLPGLPPVFGKHLSVRLLGVDAPEIRGKCEHEKTLAVLVRDLVDSKVRAAKSLILADVQRDKHFRIDATVWVDGENLNAYLLTLGLVRPYDGKTKPAGWCGSS